MRDDYEAPALSELGTLHDLTLTPKSSKTKVTSPNADFTYPTPFSFSFAP